MRKLLLIILLLLTLTACDRAETYFNNATGYNYRTEYVYLIVESENYSNYVYTFEYAYNCEYDDAYIITFYIDGLRYVKTTYLAYRIDDELYWEVISIE
jgi:dimeric dUTPase (all-alpha-NTP-PPase superfamily)